MSHGRSRNKVQVLGWNTTKMLSTREGPEWLSDDSSDEDYVNGVDNESRAKSPPQKRIRPWAKIAKRENVCISHGEVITGGDGVDRWGQLLPMEILLHIFHYVVQEEGTLPFLIRASRVNSTWHEASRAEVLWQRVDLSYGWVKSRPETICWLANHRFARLTHLNLDSWKNLTNMELLLLASKCKLLESITLSHCPKMNFVTTNLLADSFPHLHSLDLSSTSVDAVKNQSLRYFLKKRGFQLQSLILAGNIINGFQPLIEAIAQSCPKLQVLDLSNCSSRNASALRFAIEVCQKGWPQLRVLRLTNVYIVASKLSAAQEEKDHQVEDKDEDLGFPALEELSLAFSPDKHLHSPVDFSFLNRLLKSSRRLKLLDLRGCLHMRWTSLQRLPCTQVAELYLSHTYATTTRSLETLNEGVFSNDQIAAVINKWHRTLRILDVSWNVGLSDKCMDFGLQQLELMPAPCLQTLDLTGTSVTSEGVRSALKGCPGLKKLCLTSCRGLVRGIKRDHNGADLKTLRKEILKDGGE